MNKKGSLLIISGPSGSGKGTVVAELVKQGEFSLSISATTRAPRAYEVEGEHYFFLSQEAFEQMKEEGKLLEWASFCGNCYGTPKEYVEQCLEMGKNIILEIEVQGALQVKKIMPNSILIFLMAPTILELRRRLTQRATEEPQAIEKRIARAKQEMELLDQYDYVVVNETIEKTMQLIMDIASAERQRVSRNKNIKKRFKGEI